jgi:glycosyltransferase involved in cell wall biosynthesis
MSYTKEFCMIEPLVNSNLKLSAIIPIRKMENRLSNLEQTLRSLQHLPIEVILVHDDSRDGTQDQLQKLLVELSNESISLLRVEVQSPGLARNVGLRSVNSEWICFWDCDDLPQPSAYITLLQETMKQNALVGIGQICSSNQNRESFKHHLIDYDSKDFLLELANMPGFTRMVFHNSVIADNVFNDLLAGEDQCFLRDLEFLNFPFFVSSDIVYIYITSQDGQLTRNKVAQRDTEKALKYLAFSFRNMTGPMRFFAFAQIVKLLLSVIKSNIKEQKRLPLGPGLLLSVAVLGRHPAIWLKCVFYFRSHRIRLAGRDNE